MICKHDTGMIIKIEESATVRDNETIKTIEGTDKIIHIVVNGDSGIAMTRDRDKRDRNSDGQGNSNRGR